MTEPKVWTYNDMTPEMRESAEKIARNIRTTLRVVKITGAVVILGGTALLAANAISKAQILKNAQISE